MKKYIIILLFTTYSFSQTELIIPSFSEDPFLKYDTVFNQKDQDPLKTINDNISSAEKDQEQLEQDLIIIKEKIKENNERIEEATTQATIYKNQNEPNFWYYKYTNKGLGKNNFLYLTTTHWLNENE